MAQSSDADNLLDLIRQHAHFERNEATITRRELVNVLAAKTAHAKIFVGCADGLILGYASVTRDYSLWRNRTWAHLDCLFVKSDMRSKGIGRSLLNYAKKIAVEWGADRIEWQTPDWNRRAAEFYKREGATGINKIRFGIDL